MSFKRARASASSGGFGVSSETLPDDEAGHQAEAASRFRRLLIQKYLDGTTTANDTAQLAYWHIEAGGLGAEDLALHPRTACRHAAEHLRLPGSAMEILAGCSNITVELLSI